MSIASKVCVFSECKDNPTYEKDCPGWKAGCFHDDYVDFMKANCNETCGYCDGGMCIV